MKQEVDVLRISDEVGRQKALEVMRTTYRDEKNWVRADDKLVSPDEVGNPAISWFVASIAGQPIGVLRVLYEPPLDLYKEYGFKVVADGIDLEAFIRQSRIAEIGRFAVLPSQRKNLFVAVALMRAAVHETVSSGFTHYITDVFEGEQHSPYEFHRRVMGFQLVATHDTGELNCPNRRLTLLLDLRDAYRRLMRQKGWVIRYLTEGWEPELHRRMAAEPSPVAEVA